MSRSLTDNQKLAWIGDLIRETFPQYHFYLLVRDPDTYDQDPLGLGFPLVATNAPTIAKMKGFVMYHITMTPDDAILEAGLPGLATQ
jgi:hypothetical protein